MPVFRVGAGLSKQLQTAKPELSEGNANVLVVIASLLNVLAKIGQEKIMDSLIVVTIARGEWELMVREQAAMWQMHNRDVPVKIAVRVKAPHADQAPATAAAAAASTTEVSDAGK